MKNTNNIYHRIISLTVLVFLSTVMSCRKLVDIPPPTTLISTSSVYNSDASATSAQMAIYLKMGLESYNMTQLAGIMGDELKTYSTSSSQVAEYTNALVGSNVPGIWKNAYSYIYQANDVIGNLANNPNISGSVSAQLTGEAKFIRAWWHFYLTNLYGDVPLITTTDYTVTKAVGNTPQSQVYDQIIADLLDAQNKLNANYIDATDTLTTTERTRPNKVAASAFLARVYLYTKRYSLAEAAATSVISDSKYSLCPNLSIQSGNNYVFKANSSEAIWQLAPGLPSTTYTPDAKYLILQTAPAKGSTNCQTISTQLLGSFENGDQRKVQWIGTYSGFNYPFKYHALTTSTVNSLAGVPEYTMMLRLAEQYLIRAEARAQQNNIAGALSDLNVIRNRAGLGNYAGATDQASVLNAIQHERQIELFAEWGHRWFDLKRTGTVDAVMGGTTGVCQAKGGLWNTIVQLLPIPLIELQNNSNLHQNPGY